MQESPRMKDVVKLYIRYNFNVAAFHKHAKLIDFGAKQNDTLLLEWRLAGIKMIQIKQS